MDKFKPNIMIGSILILFILVIIYLFYPDKIPFLNSDDDPKTNTHSDAVTRLANVGIFVQSGVNVELA